VLAIGSKADVDAAVADLLAGRELWVDAARNTVRVHDAIVAGLVVRLAGIVAGAPSDVGCEAGLVAWPIAGANARHRPASTRQNTHPRGLDAPFIANCPFLRLIAGWRRLPAIPTPILSATSQRTEERISSERSAGASCRIDTAGLLVMIHDIMERQYILFHTGAGCLTALASFLLGIAIVGVVARFCDIDWLGLLLLMLFTALALALGHWMDGRTKTPPRQE